MSITDNSRIGEWSKGDILIVEKPPYPGANYIQRYVCIYDHSYRPHAAFWAFCTEGWKREYDRDWPVFEFTDNQVIAKMSLATERHNAYTNNLDSFINQTRENLIDSQEIEAGQDCVQDFQRKIYGNWIGSFLEREYNEYSRLFEVAED